MKILMLCGLLCVVLYPAAAAPPRPVNDPKAAIVLLNEIAQTRRESSTIGDTLWPNFSQAPFGLLLVRESIEILFCHGTRASGFAPAGIDSTTGCAMQTRKSTFPPNLLAAMPAVDGISTIVMGTPEATGRNLADWTRTIFHEHFHQYQSVLPNYYARVAALDLADGDQSGMWMLNYSFPYRDSKIDARFAALGEHLARALSANRTTISALCAEFIKARREFALSVPARDFRYFDFELWQEGVARWTEIAIALKSQSTAVRDAANVLRERTLDSLRHLDLATSGREVVYPYGAGEAMLLERCSPRWRHAYGDVLSLGPLVEDINVDDCK